MYGMNGVGVIPGSLKEIIGKVKSTQGRTRARQRYGSDQEALLTGALQKEN